MIVEYESLFYQEKWISANNCTYTKSNESKLRLINSTQLLCNSNVSIDAGTCLSFKKKEMKCFPSFMIIGAMKSGTGELMKWLNMHPMLVSGKGKDNSNEIHYFGGDKYSKSVCKHKDYIMHFPTFNSIENKKIITFDKSPDYIRNVDSLIQIKEMITNIKLILILRHPVTRAFSGFQHNCRHHRYIKIKKYVPLLKETNTMSRTFLPKGSIINIKSFFFNMSDVNDVHHSMNQDDFMVLQYPCSIDDFLSYYLNNYDLGLNEMSIGFYDLQLKQLFKLFNPKKVLILYQENMWNDTFYTLRKIENFLDIPCYNYNRVSIRPDLNLPPVRIEAGRKIILFTQTSNKVPRYSSLVSVSNNQKKMLLHLYRERVLSMYTLLKKIYNGSSDISIPNTWRYDFSIPV